MGYNNDASSSNLKPVLLAVSVVTAMLLGGMYFYYTNATQHFASSEGSAESQAQPVQQAQEQPAPSQAPITSAAKPKGRTRV